MSTYSGTDGRGPDGTVPCRSDADGAVLLGREHEKRLVETLLTDLAHQGRVLHLRGAAGTGKSALIRYAAACAEHRGIRVLSATWAPSERSLPHSALHGLLRPELARTDSLPAAERAVLDSAFGGGPTAPEPADLAAAALKLLVTAPGPVLLCIDDLDRLDTVSRGVLSAMASLRAASRVSMIVTERAASASLSAPDLLTATLDDLPDAPARALLARAGRTTGYTEAQLVLTLAGGNPLALTELSLGSGPLGDAAGFGMLSATPRLAESYAEDLRELSEPARTVLLVAALSASPVARDILDAGGLLLGSGHDARAGLAEAVARGLVTEDGETTGECRRLVFPQPLVRPAVLYLEPASRRMAAHAVLGRSLTSAPHAAWHTARCTAGPDEELAQRLEALADGPCSGTDLLVALAALEGAARLSPDPERQANRLLRAAELAVDRGLVDHSLRQGRQIDTAALGALGRALQLWVHDLIPGNTVVGRERIAELCEAARAVSGQDPVLAQKLLYAAARRCWWQQTGREERRTVREAFESLRSGPSDVLDLSVMALTDPLSVLRPPEPHPLPGLREEDEANLIAQVAHLTNDLDRAAPLYVKAEAALRADGRYGRLPQAVVPRAMGQIWLGSRWDAVHALTEEGRVVAEQTGQPEWVARATGARAVVLALEGDHEQALVCAAEVEEHSLRTGLNRQLHLASLARALTASGTGRYAEAYARLRALFAEPAGPYAYEDFWAVVFLAEAAFPAGETEDARSVVKHLASLTDSGRPPLVERMLAYAEAVIAPDEEAESRYLRALGPGVETWPLLHGMTLFGYGAWLRRRRQVTASRTPLATAESVFRALGARSRADQAASELRATGRAASVRSAGEGADSVGDDVAQVLSPQQLTITRLAARGLSNRAIAEQLRLSPRTVASHLYQIFPKLGVASRAGLAARFGAEAE
ncbi:AAA family ATPase [Streptomyces sp. NPDC004284]|uniref:AAA family ATPase n=1 Tax=Streptomyces sp. NPDC004284 TaxID=3364695 RepID=UPI00368A2326